MTDRWMNVGYEDCDELRPYVEPIPDYSDPKRLGEYSPVVVFGLHLLNPSRHLPLNFCRDQRVTLINSLLRLLAVLF